jgi:hypothetical protein
MQLIYLSELAKRCRFTSGYDPLSDPGMAQGAVPRRYLVRMREVVPDLDTTIARCDAVLQMNVAREAHIAVARG